MANKAKGTVALELGGKSFDVCLGLGALAELEDAFCVESFEDALNFGDKFSASKMRTFLRALAKGNGIEGTPDVLAGIDRYGIADFLVLLNDLTAAAGMKAQDEGAAKSGAAPLKAKSAGKRG